MSQISIVDLTFGYEGSYEYVFENINVQLDTDWKLGLVGRNGRGKTTFLNLLLGRFSHQGSISASVGFEYFPYPVRNQEQMALDVVEEIVPGFEYWQLSRELNYLEFDQEGLYRPYSSLSFGERTKVLLAILFLKENQFLLIDEPTNHLDMDTRKIIATYLNKKKGFILVSHDREFLDGCVDHIMSINPNEITVTKGNFSIWWENKSRQDAFELAEHEKLQKDIRRLTQAARRSGQWADKMESAKIGFHSQVNEKFIGTRAYLGEKSRKLQQRRKNLERRQQRTIEDKNKLLKNLEQVEELKLFPKSYQKSTLLEARDVCLQYGSKTVIETLSLKLENGERIALYGKNGCGKSTVLKALLGEIKAVRGELSLPEDLNISYVSQDTDWLTGTLDEFVKQQNLDGSLFRAILRKLGFSRAQFEKSLDDYSAGQKKKVLIAGSLCRQAHLYIWDEPLNYIDVFSRMQIEQLILDYQPTMIFVEHDCAFVERIATRVEIL